MTSIRDYLRENAEFDVGMRQQNDPQTYSYDEFGMRGRGDIGNRKNANARYGDNAMSDPSKLDEDEAPDNVDRLHAALTRAGISDDEIKAGITLTDGGKQKVAAALGVASGSVDMLMNNLCGQLRDDKADEPVFEADDHGRYTYEDDYLNNVTVRDSTTGKSVYLQGSQATALLAKLKANPSQEQALLATVGSLMEGDGGEADGPSGYDDEIDTDLGSTYNFTWNVDGRHGSGTASYTGEGTSMHIELVRVADEDGDEFEPDPRMKRGILSAAKDFIDEA